MYSLIRSTLFRLPAETSHNLGLKGLKVAHKLGLLGLVAGAKPASQPAQIMGLTVDNPVGLAAGLDKNGEYIDALAALGFGFIEIGTITPKGQPGNPLPRMFRLPARQAIINRMGFNNHGVDYLLEQVKQAKYSGVLGINIGKNKDTPAEQAVDDYLICMRKVYQHASYITVNLSSPNTPGLRDLQFGEPLEQLLAALKTEQASLADKHGKYVPLAVKIAPDMAAEDVANVAASFKKHKIDAVIATNTTISREAVKGLPHCDEAGGLSGAPVKTASTEVIKLLSQALGDEVELIGVGGICSGSDAAEKIQAGAKVVQLYTGFIYRGPQLIRDVLSQLR